MEREVHEYEGEDVTVTYDAKRCIHARECVRGLPAAFDPDRRPWIDPDAAAADDLAEVVTRCPTGALHFERTDGGPGEPTPGENTVTVTADGPLYVRGDVDVTGEDGTVRLSDTRVALCRCGASANEPLCDGSHREIGFEADGTVAGASTAEGSPEGGLTVTPTANGPLHLEGEVRIDGEDGSTWRGEEAWLCRCGGSGEKPFCDGTHARIGFETGQD